MGTFRETKVFPTAVREAKLAIDDLWRAKDVIRRKVLAACRASNDHDLDLKLVEITREEVRKGWLKGSSLLRIFLSLASGFLAGDSLWCRGPRLGPLTT